MANKTAERRLGRWLTISGAGYALTGADFLLRPRAPLDSLSRVAGEELDEEDTGVYHSLTVAYMATIAALALGASRDPGGRRELVPALLVAKATSSGALLYRFYKTRRKAFAVGAALDAVLLGVTGGLYAALDDR